MRGEEEGARSKASGPHCPVMLNGMGPVIAKKEFTKVETPESTHYSLTFGGDTPLTSGPPAQEGANVWRPLAVIRSQMMNNFVASPFSIYTKIFSFPATYPLKLAVKFACGATAAFISLTCAKYSMRHQ